MQQKNEAVEWLRHFSNLIMQLPVPPGSMLIHGSHAEVIGHYIKKQFTGIRAYANLTQQHQIPVAQVALDGFQMNSLDSVDVSCVKDLNSSFIEFADCDGMSFSEVLCMLEAKIPCESSVVFLAMQYILEHDSPHLTPEYLCASDQDWLCLNIFISQDNQTLQPATRSIAVLIHTSFDLSHFTELVIEHEYISCGWWILNQIDSTRLACQKSNELLFLCRLKLIVHWMKDKPLDERLVYFALAIQEFNQIMACSDMHLPESSRYMSEAWLLLGDHEMASRTQRTACQILGRSEKAVFDSESLLFSTVDTECHVPNLIYESDTPPHHVLYVVPPQPHYGLDCLYDGLYQVLHASGSLVEFPYKPTLHGSLPDCLAEYPCCFNHDGMHIDVNHIQTLLNDKYFDVILWGDVEFSLDSSVLRPLLSAIQRSGIPVYLVDAADECVDYRKKFIKAVPNIPIAGYFKREMLQCIDYGPDAFPMPFSYPDALAIQDFSMDKRSNPIFWAGHRKAGFRRNIVEKFEYMWKVQLDTHYDQSTYMRMMRSSIIGLNCFGYGFDTVRYWEVPAQGCLLLSEKSPLCIPNNFSDGKNALFFDDIADLVEKLNFCKENPDKVFEMALAGWNHFRQYHTNSKRAHYVLSRIQQSAIWPKQ